MRPRPLPALALCSLACSVTLVGLWAVSWWRCPYARYANPAGRWPAGPWTAVARCEDGVASFVWWGPTFGNVTGLSAHMVDRDPGAMLGSRLQHAALGFEAQQVGIVGRGLGTVVSVPLWAPILLTALPPLAWARRQRRRGARGFEVEVTADRAAGTSP